MTLAPILATHGISQRQLARESGQSLAAINAIVSRGEWPKRRTAAVRASVVDALRNAGATTAELRAIALPTQEKAPGAPTPEAFAGAASAAPASPPQPVLKTVNERDLSMLFEKVPLYPKTLEHFGLKHAPFSAHLEHAEDVFKGQGYQYAMAALKHALDRRGFVAIVAESGAGKTVVIRELEQECLPRYGAADSQQVLIRPYVLGMEEDDRKGKTIKASHIATAIMRALAPGERLKRDEQDRFAQVHAAIANAHAKHRKVLLLIDEAHGLPTPTLRHLKRFAELSLGRSFLLGVALVGQPEVLDRLKRLDHREISSRLEIHHLSALSGNEVGDYLRHRLARAGVRYENVFAPDAAGALEAALYRQGDPAGGNMAFPQIVNNMAARCMNTAALAGWPHVDAEVVGSVLQDGA